MPYVWFLTCAIFSEHQKLYVKGQDIKQKICFCGRSKNCEKGLFVMCVCVLVRLSGWNNSAATGQISLKFSIWGLFEILSRKFKFDENWTRITGTLHEDQCTFIIIRRWILLRMRSILCQICTENQSTLTIFNKIFFTKIAPFMRQCGKIL